MVSKENYDLDRFHVNSLEPVWGWSSYVDLKSGQFVIERIVTGAAIRMYSVSAKFGCRVKGFNPLNFIEEKGSWYLIQRGSYSTSVKEDSYKILILTPWQARMVKHLLKRKY